MTFPPKQITITKEDHTHVHFEGDEMPVSKVYTIPALKRLPAYLRELRVLHGKGERSVASPGLAEALHLDSMTVRKDLEMIGVAGLTGVGYPIEKLIDGIETFLGWKNTSDVFLAGTGEIGSALLGFRGFSAYGLKIIAAFDRNPQETGGTIHGVPVFPLSEFRHLTERLQVKMAILCVPEEEAQEVELMADAGIMAIWNFTRQPLHLPPDIIRQQVNLAGDLAVLSVKLAEKLHKHSTPGESGTTGENRK